MQTVITGILDYIATSVFLYRNNYITSLPTVQGMGYYCYASDNAGFVGCCGNYFGYSLEVTPSGQKLTDGLSVDDFFAQD